MRNKKTDSEIIIHLVSRNGMNDSISTLINELYPLVEREYMRFVTNEKLENEIVQFCPVEAYILEAGIIDSCDSRTAGDKFYNGSYVINIFIKEDDTPNDLILFDAFKIISEKFLDRNTSFYGKEITIFSDDFIRADIDCPTFFGLWDKFFDENVKLRVITNKSINENGGF